MKSAIDKRIVHITELLSALIAIADGIFLLLAAFNILPFSIENCWLLSLYVSLFIISLFITILQKNSIGCGFVFALSALIIARILVLVGFTHRQIYPLYVLALPLGLMSAMFFIHSRGILFKVSAALIGMSFLLFIESFSVLSFKAVLPIIVIYFGILGLIYACCKLKNYKENK